jgi:hypothetical protein
LDQKTLYDLIVGHYEKILYEHRGQLRQVSRHNTIHLLGVRRWPVMPEENFLLLQAASTGVAAYGISGRTLHALFRFPVVKSGISHGQLNAQNPRALRATFREVFHLITDEKLVLV